MKQTFGSNVSVADQKVRVMKGKQVGKKHNHTMGPGKKAQKQSTHAANVVKQKNAKDRKRRDQVADYFAGKIDQYPK